MSKSLAMRAAAVLLVAAVAGFIVLRLLSASGDLSSVPAVERPDLLVLGSLLFAGTLFTYALLWRTIVGRLDGARPPLVDSVAVFWASWLGRYVPTSLPYVAGKFVMGLRLGHSKPALAASVLYENAFVVAVGAASSAVLIPMTLTVDKGGPLVYAGVGLAGAGGLALLSPPVFQRLFHTAMRLARRELVGTRVALSYGGMAAALGLTAVALVLNGAAFALVLASFAELDAREAVASAAIFNLAGVAGIAVVALPSGLFVREAVLIGLTQLIVPLEVATAAAIVARLVVTTIDVALGLTGAALVALRQRELPAAGQTLPQRR